MIPDIFFYMVHSQCKSKLVLARTRSHMTGQVCPVVRHPAVTFALMLLLHLPRQVAPRRLYDAPFVPCLPTTQLLDANTQLPAPQCSLAAHWSLYVSCPDSVTELFTPVLSDTDYCSLKLLAHKQLMCQHT